MYALVEPLGLHRGQSMVLKALGGHDGSTNSALADLLCVRPATMTNMVNRLEQAGLVERRPDARDQRVSHIYLTGAGSDIQDQVQRVWMDFEAQVFQGLDQGELSELRRVFEHIQTNLAQLADDSDS
jgi:DNA-binding MarR family transcriptional regulator